MIILIIYLSFTNHTERSHEFSVGKDQIFFYRFYKKCAREAHLNKILKTKYFLTEVHYSVRFSRF